MSQTTSSLFRIDEGVFLEDVNVLLPWSASVDELATLADARLLASDSLDALIWGVHRCFGGLKVAPKRLRDSDASRQCFVLDLPDFANDHPREVFDRQVLYLSTSFGPPHEQGQRSDGYNSFPFAAWYFGSVRLSHAMQERFVEWNTTMLYRSASREPH